MQLEFIHIAAIVLFSLKIASGIWLRKKGRPIPTGLLTLHKFIALGTAALIAMVIRRLYLEYGMDTSVAVTVIFTGILFLMAILTGGLLSIEKPVSRVVKIFHQTTPWLAALFTLLAIYLFLN
jgi:hypothetical protein